MLAARKIDKPTYTTGFLPVASEMGPKKSGPIPIPRKIIVISSWLSIVLAVPIAIPITSKAGNKASIARATTDINAAIKATNSTCEYLVSFCTVQKYFNLFTFRRLVGFNFFCLSKVVPKE